MYTHLKTAYSFEDLANFKESFPQMSYVTEGGKGHFQRAICLACMSRLLITTFTPVSYYEHKFPRRLSQAELSVLTSVC